MDECNRIDDIIDEVRRLNKDMFSGTAAETAAEGEGSDWSLEDIDRLIAGESVSHEKPAQIGQDDFKTDEVIPGVTTAEIEQPDFDEAFSFEEELKKIENDISNELPPEITDGMFTDKPLHLFKDSEESDDIFSGEQPELDGQETLYNTEEADFNISDFNLETVIMPEQEPLKPSKYPGVKAIVDTLYENKNTASEYFEKSRRSITAVDDAPVSPDDYKTRFFAKPVVSSSEDIDVISLSPVDRSGIVVSRSKSSDEGGLEPMPTVLSAEEALKRGSDAVFPETVSENVDSNDVDSQIMFSGFETVDEESMPVNANAAEIESDLEDKRKKRIEKFRLKTPDDETGSALDALDYQPPVKKQKRDKAAVIANEADSEEINTIDDKNEYTDPSQRESIRRMLAERSKKSLSRVIGIAAIEVLLFIISLIPPLFEKLSIETSLFSNETAVPIIGIILLVVAGGLYADKLKYGFETLFGLKPTAESAVSVACVVALIQAVYAAVTGSNAFCVAALALILVSSAADMLDDRRILDNFAVCAFKYENASFAVHALENEAEKFEIGRGILMGNPSILYSSAVAFPEKFIEKSRENPVEPSYSSASVFAAAGLSILAAVICGFKLHSFSQAFGAFACAFCCAGGIVLKFMPSFALYNVNRKLNSNGTMITSIPVADNIKQANAVAVDAENIFDLSQCTMHGMKDFKNMRIDDVLLYAAAIVIKSGGPLKESFRSVIDGQEDLLPSVKELVYEDKMGITGRIADQKVLLGNRNMLIHHNIEIPSEKYEAKYSKGGRKVIYLACNGKLCALFVVSYKADKRIGQQLKELEKNGISLLVRTNDVNITEGFIAKAFGINKSNIKVLSSVASRLYKRRKEALTEKLPAGIIHSGSAYTMLSAVTESCRLSSRNKLSFGISLALSVIGGIITAVMLTGNVGAFAGTLATIFIFASSLISSLVS